MPTGVGGAVAGGGGAPWPLEIRLDKAGRVLRVSFEGGRCFALPFEYLRVESPSAEVRGHGVEQRRILGGCRAVEITGIEPVGHYAVRLCFSDGHDTGLFSWRYLYELGDQMAVRWARYLEALAARGMSRD